MIQKNSLTDGKIKDSDVQIPRTVIKIYNETRYMDIREQLDSLSTYQKLQILVYNHNFAKLIHLLDNLENSDIISIEIIIKYNKRLLDTSVRFGSSSNLGNYPV